MARRGRKRCPALTSGVNRLLWLSRIRRRKAPAAAAAAAQRQPAPAPPSAAAAAQRQPAPAPPSAAAAEQRQPAPVPPSSAAAAQSRPPPPAPPSACDTAQPQQVPPPSAPAPPSASPTPSPSSSSDTRLTFLPTETPPRESNKRKAAESLADAAKKLKREQSTAAAEPVRKKLTLEEIRELPPTATRPFYPRTLLPGSRSIKEPEAWKCWMCHHVNEPKHHLLFSLPAFVCERCGSEPRESEGDVDFGFCYADLGINDSCPIGHVKNQRHGECVPNAVCSCVEITDRIMMTILDEPMTKEGPHIDIRDLLSKYKKKWLEEGNKELEGEEEGYSILSLLTMLRVFQSDGVKEKSNDDDYDRDSDNEQEDTTTNESNKLHRISDWGFLDPEDFVALSSALADGYPLIFGFNLGKKIAYLEPGQIYMPPTDYCKSEDGKEPERHVSVLVGAQQEKRIKFFYFLNCWDTDFCRRSLEEGDGIRGGVGAISREGIKVSIQVLRFNERAKQKVQGH